MTYINPQPAQGTVTGITYYLMQKKSTNNNEAVVKKIASRGDQGRKVSQRSVIAQMAARLASSVHRNFSPSKKKNIPQGKLTAAAANFLRSGLSVEETAEKLERFGS